MQARNPGSSSAHRSSAAHSGGLGGTAGAGAAPNSVIHSATGLPFVPAPYFDSEALMTLVTPNTRATSALALTVVTGSAGLLRTALVGGALSGVAAPLDDGVVVVREAIAVRADRDGAALAFPGEPRNAFPPA